MKKRAELKKLSDLELEVMGVVWELVATGGCGQLYRETTNCIYLLVSPAILPTCRTRTRSITACVPAVR